MHRLLRRSWVQVVVGTLLLMAVIVVNGRPTVFTDTDDYYAQGRGAAHAVKPLVQPLIHSILHPKSDPDDDSAYLEAEADEDHTSMAARSPYYGVFLYSSYKLGTLWLLAGLQSLIAAWTLYCFVRGAVREMKVWTYPAIMAGISAFSTLPFFTGFAMPDVFAPLGAVATITLAVFWNRFGWLERIGLLLVTTTSLWFHTSHVLLELILIVSLSAVLWWFRTDVRRIGLTAGLLTLTVVSAFASDFAYHEVVRYRTGEELHRPPFLVARVLADGPGRIYLREACAKSSPYVLCRYKRNPLDNSDEILWADDPARGIFNASKVPVRIALEQEEKAFVLATLVHYPVSQLAASLSNWWEQLSLIDLAEPLRDPSYYFSNIYWKDTSLPGLIPGGLKCVKAPKLCRPNLDMDALQWDHGLTILFSSLFLLWRFTRKDMIQALAARDALTPGGREAAVAVALLVVIAVIMNAGVTGILSGPFSRYHARMVWLIPALAFTVCAALGPGFSIAGAWAGMKRKARGEKPHTLAS